MTKEQERWAEAIAILKWQGDNVRLYLAKRIAALAAEVSQDGVERFKDIAAKVDALVGGSIQ